MRRFFDDTINTGIDTHILSEIESKHVCKVLRMNEGDQLELVNGNGYCFVTEITVANAKKCQVKIIDTTFEAPSNKEIHIAIAPTKMNERTEWFLEKATELGITEITFLKCGNSERKQIKLDRFEKIIISAVKQSKRLYSPKVNDLTDIKSFIEQHKNGLIAECYDGDKSDIQTEFNNKNCPILIGPEGDFTMEEVNFAHQNGYKSISLGSNRLRTETAALYACMQALIK